MEHTPTNLDAPPEGFGRSADGSLIPNADRVQGPSDIKTQYHQDSIPEQFPEQIERNRAAGLDAKGNPIPGATLSPAAQASVAYEASLHVVETPAPVGRAAAFVVLPTDQSTAIGVNGESQPTHVAVPVADVSEFTALLAMMESIPQHVRDFWHRIAGQHAA